MNGYNKVLSIGAPKTGNTSLKMALQILGFNVTQHPRNIDMMDKIEAATALHPDNNPISFLVYCGGRRNAFCLHQNETVEPSFFRLRKAVHKICILVDPR